MTVPFSKRAVRIAVAFLGGVTVCEGYPLTTMLSSRPIPWLVHWGVGTPLAWLLSVVVFALYARHTLRSSDLIREWRLKWHWLRLLVLPMAVVTGIFEEAFFRKFLMNWTAHSSISAGWSLALQIAVSALGFGAVHAVWGLAGGSVVGAGYAMYYTALLGAGLAVVYLVGGRALAPCVAAHVAINLVCEPWMILSAATGSWSRRRS